MKLSVKEKQLAFYFGKSLFEVRPFKLKDLSITSRVFNYWKANEVLTWFPEHKTNTFTFIEAAWLLVMEKLRKFGVAIEAMRNLTDQLVTAAFKKNLAKDSLKDKLPGIPEFFLQNEVSHFSEMVKWMLSNKSNAQLIVDQQYEAFIMEEEELLKPENIQRLFSSMHIIIPLKPVLQQLFDLQIESGSFVLPSNTEKEILLIETIKTGEVDVIKVSTSSKTVKLDLSSKEHQAQLSSMFLNGILKNSDNLEVKMKGVTKYISLSQKP